MDFDRLRFVSERADFSETLISVTVPERPGAFQVSIYRALALQRWGNRTKYKDAGRSVSEVCYPHTCFRRLYGDST